MKVWKIFRNIISSIIVFILINSMIVFSYASEQNTVDKKLEPNIEALITARISGTTEKAHRKYFVR